jgi:predicted phosphodiesterase
MKTLITADWHYANPITFLKEKIKKEKIDRLAFLGDCSRPDILEKFIEMNIPKICLLGNHDHPFAYSLKNGMLHKSVDCLGISDEEIDKRAKIWRTNDTLRNYARKFIAKKDGEVNFGYSEKIGNDKIHYVHGLLYYPFDNRLSEQLWGFLLNNRGSVNDNILKQNLLEMINQDYRILFIGHTHRKEVYSVETKVNPMISPIWYQGNPNLKEQDLKLEYNRRYIISVGAFCDGDYGIFDDERREVRLAKI